MTPSRLRAKVISERSAWIGKMLQSVRTLPLDSYAAFRSDPRNVAAAESFVRRGLEALFDLGRHLLAKGFGEAVSEYKEIAQSLVGRGVLSEQEGARLRELAGYRNRMVHFYQEISDRELYELCTEDVIDIEQLLNAMIAWAKAHPEMIDQSM